jgi:Tol biopolymer transport system component
MLNQAFRTLGLLAVAATLAAIPARGQQATAGDWRAKETHLRNITKLTTGGENAEAYFSPDGKRLVYQSTHAAGGSDQIYSMKIDGSDRLRISSGTGRTTCGYFYPNGDSILFASTHLAGAECPPKPGYERGYVWPVYASYDIFRTRSDGSGLEQLTKSPGYDAEATIAPDGLVTFTSTRDGDLEIYTMRGDGSGVKRLTHRPGPDGGPFFSWDGQMIAFRGHELKPGAELDDYLSLLKDGLWRPTALELYVMDRDGNNVHHVTKLGGANFAPSWTPDGKRLIFASNHHNPKGRNFDIFMIHVDGTGLEQITFNETFDGFPMFSPDGTKLVFASNRDGQHEGETNVFIADWVR